MIKEISTFSKGNIENSEFTKEQMIEIAERPVKIRERWQSESWNISLATCAEQVDLKEYGIEHNRCIDGELTKHIFSDDKDLVYYLNFGKMPGKNSLFPDGANPIPLSPGKLKDKGQRKVCGCMTGKDIGMYNTCPHHCIYCYVNTSKEAVKKNLSLHRNGHESILNKQETSQLNT